MIEHVTPLARIYGHGSITLTYYPLSGRIGVLQVGNNAVMDTRDLIEFMREAGLADQGKPQVTDDDRIEAAARMVASTTPHDLWAAMAAIRAFSRPQITEQMVEAGARAEFEYVRSLRPDGHGPYLEWDDEPEAYREYARSVTRAGLEAALGGEV